MTDAVAAVKWTVKHLVTLGAHPNQIFVSGHSAGGNIAANLVCGTWADHVLSKYQVAIRGAVCMSGVYSLLNPLGGSYASIKNKGFDKLYRLRVFGDDFEVLACHSPVAQLRMMLGELPYPVDQCKLCNMAHALSQWMCPATSTKASHGKGAHGKDDTGISSPAGTIVTTQQQSNNIQSTQKIKRLEDLTTSFLVLNASSDVGLETDGRRFVELLERVQCQRQSQESMSQDQGLASSTTFSASSRSKSPRPCEYHVLPGLGHATITLDEEALSRACSFIHQIAQ